MEEHNEASKFIIGHNVQNSLVLRYEPQHEWVYVAWKGSISAVKTFHDNFFMKIKDLERAKSEHYFPAKDPSV